MTIRTRKEADVTDLLAGSGFELISSDTLADLLDIAIDYRDVLHGANQVLGSGPYHLSTGGIWVTPQQDVQRQIDRINEVLKRVQEQV